MSKWLLSAIFALFALSPLFSQNIYYDSGFSMRNGQLSHYYDMVSWDDTGYKEFTTWTGNRSGNQVTAMSEFMNFRIIFPPGYDKTGQTKYPMILMLHGAGESGRVWTGRYEYETTDPRYDNNGHNLLHGGEAHRNAVNRNPSDSRAFPGIVVFPQVSYNGAWGGVWNDGELGPTGQLVARMVEYLIDEYNVDEYRIAVHGLSNGGKGVWDISSKRPDLFSAVLPMSGLGSDKDAMTDVHVTTPFWLFQGGLDGNPDPYVATTWIDALEAKGAAPRFYLYPDLGHGVWNTAYNEPDFFSWILSQHKKNIYIFGGDPGLCTGGYVKLGFSDGFLAYQWTKDGVDIPGATTRYYEATELGTYTVKFQRVLDSLWDESFPVEIIEKTQSTYSPLLTVSGTPVAPVYNGSSALVSNPNSSDIRTDLVAPTGFSQYYWYKDGIQQGSATASNIRNLFTGNGILSSGNVGNWTVQVLEPSGCPSLLSAPITFTFTNPQPSTERPVITSISALSPTEVRLNWTNVSYEEGYEIWRYRGDNSNPGELIIEKWNYLTTLPANTSTWVDNTVKPSSTYRYEVRAIRQAAGTNQGGTFSHTNQQWANFQVVTPADNVAPGAPYDLTVESYTSTSVTLSWVAATDNDEITHYQVFNGENQLGADVIPVINPDNSLITYTVTGLTPSTLYYLNVRAVDYSNNTGPFANAVTVTTLANANGLNYRYYEFSGTLSGAPNQLTDFNYNQTPTASGIVGNIDITPRLRNDQFVFEFTGYIQIDEPGRWTFWTRSDDGSRLFIDGVQVVNNDEAHATRNRTGYFDFPSAGLYAIRATFFEQSGGEVMEVKYRYGDYPGTSDANFNAASYIPDEKLFLTNYQDILYYSKATGNLEDLSTWGLNTDGSGSQPANFTTARQHFIITNRPGNSADLSSNWTVSGSGSKVIVGENTTLNLNAELNGVLEGEDNAIVNVGSTIMPRIGIMAATSTINFNMTSGTIPNGSYGNVNINNTGVKNLPANTMVVKGNLSVNGGASIEGSQVNLSEVRVSGNISLGSDSSPAENNRFAIAFTGGTGHSINTTAANITLFSLKASSDDIITINNGGSGTLTLGSTLGGGLTLESGAILDLGTNNLTITGRGVVNPNDELGEIRVNNTDITISSSAAQVSTLRFVANENTVSNLSINTSSSLGGVNIGNSLNVRESLTITNGELECNDGNLVLLSDASGTARINPIGANGRVLGEVTFQRYMEEKGQIYRYISSPVKGATVADLQQYITITGNFDGAHTGPGISSLPSLFDYDGTTWQAFPPAGGSNLDTLRRGRGYSILLWGGSTPITWEAIGNPNQGDLSFDLIPGTGSPNDGWNLLGNPYPAPIQWTGAQGSGWSTFQGLSQTVWVRENFAGGAYQWRVYYPGITDPGQNGAILPNGIIAPGQSFWVQATENPALTITEQAKATTNPGFYRTSDEPLGNVLSIRVSKGTQNDVAYIHSHQSATDEYNKIEDAVKLQNSFFNLSSKSDDGIALSVNVISNNFCRKEVPINVERAGIGSYEMAFAGITSFAQGEHIFLQDAYTGLTTELTVDNQVYNFEVNKDLKSRGTNRFILIFEKPVVETTNLLVNGIDACENGTPQVEISNLQPGVNYWITLGDSPVSDVVVTDGTDKLIIPIQREKLGSGGTYEVTLQAAFSGCQAATVNTLLVTIDTLQQPVIQMEESGLLRTNVNDSQASFQWFYNDSKLKGATDATLSPIGAGVYSVQVSKGTCSETSVPFSYVITNTPEEIITDDLVYPNPFNDFIRVKMSNSMRPELISIVTPLGQPIKIDRLSEDQANGTLEIHVANIPSGPYILSVGNRKFRLIKK